MADRTEHRCFQATAEAYRDGQLTFEQLLDHGLEHFRLAGRRYEHEEQDASDDSIAILANTGPGGFVLAAEKLCILVTPRVCSQLPLDVFRPLLLACRNQPWPVIRDMAVELVVEDVPILQNDNLRQVMVMVALKYGHSDAASQLIKAGPPPDRSLFSMPLVTISRKDNNLTDKVLLALIEQRWFEPHLFLFIGNVSAEPESGIQIIDFLCYARRTSQVIKDDLMLTVDDLMEAVASRGHPLVLDHLLKRLSLHSRPPPMLVPAATKYRSAGSLDMLRYLVEEHKLDVNWYRSEAPQYNNTTWIRDPRERAQMECYQEPLPGGQTALHGAAENGDIEAVKYLLGNGAGFRRDGSNRDPWMRATAAGQKRVEKILAASLRGENISSL